MSTTPDWQNFIVTQRRPATGCIPTGYEIILRSAQTKGIDFDTFQDDFDLDAHRQPNEPAKNNFDSVAQAINQRYPEIKFSKIAFPKDQGKKKLEAVEGMLQKHIPVLISLALAAFGSQGWHIMLVVDSTPDELTLLWSVNSDGTPDTRKISKNDFVYVHEQFDGGNDIAFLSLDPIS